MKQENYESYNSANVFPTKILYDTHLTNVMLNKKKVIPRCIQITPTNKCDLRCSYCCCDEVDRKQEMPFKDIQELIKIVVDLGVRAVVISGGGEPMCYPKILETIDLFHDNKISVGLITNGNHFNDDMLNTLDKVSWCRISFDSERKITEKYKRTIETAAKSKCKFGFSFVMTKNEKFGEIDKIVDFANEHDNFTHVRIVNDSIEGTEIDTNDALEYLKSKGINTDKCFFKKQQQYFKGVKNCYMSLLKPRITATGEIYPCCAIQYQFEEYKRDYPPEFSMGRYTDLPELVEKQNFFNGAVCKQCYYSGYNELLKKYIQSDKIHDKEFL